jgi:hypothetical protein
MQLSRLRVVDRVYMLGLLRDLHERARRNGTVLENGFLLIFEQTSGRRFAVSEYGSTFYDEGLEVYFAIDLETGAYVPFRCHSGTGYLPKVSKEGDQLVDAFNTPALIPAEDPIRRWLAGSHGGGPLRIETREHMFRFSAVEILRTDQPQLLKLVEPDYSPLRWREPELALLGEHFDPEVLPYFVLFGKNVSPITSIGSGAGRRRQP